MNKRLLPSCLPLSVGQVDVPTSKTKGQSTNRKRHFIGRAHRARVHSAEFLETNFNHSNTRKELQHREQQPEPHHVLTGSIETVHRIFFRCSQFLKQSCQQPKEHDGKDRLNYSRNCPRPSLARSSVLAVPVDVIVRSTISNNEAVQKVDDNKGLDGNQVSGGQRT